MTHVQSYECRASASALIAARSAEMTNPDFFVTNSSMKKISIVRLKGGSIMATYSRHQRFVKLLAAITYRKQSIHEQERVLVASVDASNAIHVWDPQEDQPGALLEISGLDNQNFVALSGVGTSYSIESARPTFAFLLIVATTEPSIKIYDESGSYRLISQVQSLCSSSFSQVEFLWAYHCPSQDKPMCFMSGVSNSKKQIEGPEFVIVDLIDGQIARSSHQHTSANSIEKNIPDIIANLGVDTNSARRKWNVLACDAHFVLCTSTPSDHQHIASLWDLTSGRKLGVTGSHSAEILCGSLRSIREQHEFAGLVTNRFKLLCATGGADAVVHVTGLLGKQLLRVASIQHSAWVRAVTLPVACELASAGLLTAGDRNQLNLWSLDEALRELLWAQRKHFAIFVHCSGLLWSTHPIFSSFDLCIMIASFL